MRSNKSKKKVYSLQYSLTINPILSFESYSIQKRHFGGGDGFWLLHENHISIIYWKIPDVLPLFSMMLNFSPCRVIPLFKRRYW